MKNRTKTVRRIDAVAAIIFILGTVWFLASWLEIILHNTNTEYVYNTFNLFEVFIRVVNAL